jgi:sugar phosphate isomerase/epimerase
MPDVIPIALQLYSVRNEAKADLRGTMQQVASWGYDGVEFAGFHGHSAEQVKAWLDEFGLACPSTHTGIDQLADEKFEQTVAFHKTIGCNAILVPGLPVERRNSLDACKATAELFNALVEKLRPLGMRVGFHVHNQDVIPLQPPDGDGRSPWDLFAELTHPQFILQYDTANGLDGGTDPVATIRKHPGRNVLLHLKEFGDGTRTLKGHDGHGKAAIGDGDVDWPGVFKAATEVGGTKWYIIEQEGHPKLSPMDAAKLCLTNLKRLLGR